MVIDETAVPYLERLASTIHEQGGKIAIGRTLIAEPDFLVKTKNDNQCSSPCDQCNKCVGYIDKRAKSTTDWKQGH